jgi:hypothetical protein
MNVSQTKQELDQIQQELEAYLKPRVLDFTNAGNINLLAGYLQAHNSSKDGIVDASFANFRAAILALKSSLVWTTAPVSKAPEQSSRLQQLNHAAPKEEKPKQKGPIERAAEDGLKMNVRKIWDECAGVVTSWQGRSHGHTYRGRERLKAIVTQAHTGADPLNIALARATLEAVKKAADKIYDESQF